MVSQRATGRTTMQALGIIRKAMMNNGTPIRIQNDHWGSSYQLRLNLANVTMTLVNKMGLKGFTLNRASLEITCNFDPAVHLNSFSNNNK